MVPELPVAMLACAKLGAIHVVVFSGFSAVAVRDRLEDCQPKILVTCDGSYRRGKPIATKPQADEAIAGLKCIEKVVVVKRNGQETPMTAGRDVWWQDTGYPMPRLRHRPRCILLLPPRRSLVSRTR
jgi:acetyl-CoA synthetase